MTIVENSIIAFTGRFETFFEVSLFVCKILLSDTLIYVCIFCKLVTVFFFFYLHTTKCICWILHKLQNNLSLLQNTILEHGQYLKKGLIYIPIT